MMTGEVIMIMYDAYNTPAFDPVDLGADEACSLIAGMVSDGTPVHVQALPSDLFGESVTVFWTVTPRGEVGTVFEHTRQGAFNVPLTDADHAVEALRFAVQDAACAQYDRDAAYAVGE